jgi:hypothetical protein
MILHTSNYQFTEPMIALNSNDSSVRRLMELEVMWKCRQCLYGRMDLNVLHRERL